MEPNRVSYVLKRAAQLRKATDLSQHDAMVRAHEDWRELEEA